MADDNLLRIGVSVELAALQSGMQQAVALTSSATQQMAAAFRGTYEQARQNIESLSALTGSGEKRKLAAVKAALEEEHGLREQALNRKLQLYAADFDEYQKILGKLQRTGEQYQLEAQKAQRQTTLARAKDFDGFFNHINAGFAHAVRSMVYQNRTFGRALAQSWNQMVGEFAVAVEKMVVGFLASRLRMLVFHQAVKTQEVAADEAANAEERDISFASTIKEVTNQAVKAAVKAYAWGAEIGGPPLGAIMAGLAFAGVEAFGALASAAGGWERVPADQLALVHKNEMVLPAHLADGLRQVISAGSLAVPQLGMRPPSGAGGSFHFHSHTNINAVDAASVQDLLESHGDVIGRIAIRKVQRWLKSSGVMS